MVTGKGQRKWQFHETAPVKNVSWQTASRTVSQNQKSGWSRANEGSLVSLKGLTRYLQCTAHDYIPQELAHPKIKEPFSRLSCKKKKSPSRDCSSTQLHKPTKSLFRSACYLLLTCSEKGKEREQTVKVGMGWPNANTHPLKTLSRL